MGAYAASKFALEAISMSLRAEVAKDGVRVLVVRPGPVETPFRDNSVANLPAGESAGVRPKGSNPQSPEEVAERTWRAIDSGAAVLETSLFVRAASFAGRSVPPIMRKIAARMAK
jgi:short-subunit dehydrogenase